MKTTLFCILLLLSGIVSAQTIDHPPFKARSGSISNITRIECTPENTRVYIHAIFRPHWWIMEDGDTYLEDAATGKKYHRAGCRTLKKSDTEVTLDEAKSMGLSPCGICNPPQ